MIWACYYSACYIRLLNYKVETNQSKNEKLDKLTVIAWCTIVSIKFSVAQLEQDLLNSLCIRCKIESLVEQDESEDLEEKIEYLPEVYRGEDGSDEVFTDPIEDNKTISKSFSKRILVVKEFKKFALLNKVKHAVFLAKSFAAKEVINRAFSVGIGQGINSKYITILN